MMYTIKVKDDSTKESIIVVCPSAISVKEWMVFKSGKCQLAKYEEGDDFLEVLQKVNDYIN